MTTTSVYFILQLDSIRVALMALFATMTALMAIRKLHPWLGWCDSTTGSAAEKQWVKRMEESPTWDKLLWSLAAAFLVGAFVPDTKTAAAAVIAPQIANSAFVQRDIPELYTLAIGKLKSALGSEQPKVEAVK